MILLRGMHTTTTTGRQNILLIARAISATSILEKVNTKRPKKQFNSFLRRQVKRLKHHQRLCPMKHQKAALPRKPILVLPEESDFGQLQRIYPCTMWHMKVCGTLKRNMRKVEREPCLRCAFLQTRYFLSLPLLEKTIRQR